MMKRISIVATVLAIVALALFLLARRMVREDPLALRVDTAPEASKPSLLLITVEGPRADRLGAYGASRSGTAYLNGLAEAGVTFEDVWAPTPMSLPSHATLMTGLLPPAHGLRVDGVGVLPDAAETLAQRLRVEGYRTAAFIAGSRLADRHGLNRGFDVYDVPPENPDRHELAPAYRDAATLAGRAFQWLQIYQAEETDEPFFLWLQFSDPLPPLLAREEIFRGFLDSPYDAELAFLDLQIGRLFAWLDDTNRKAQTLVAVVGAHGQKLSGDAVDVPGFSLERSALGVPLLLAWPGQLPGGHRVAGAMGLDGLAGGLSALLGIGKDSRDAGHAAFEFEQAARGVIARIPDQTVYLESGWPHLAFGWSPLQGVVDDALWYRQGAGRGGVSRADGQALAQDVEDRMQERLAQLDSKVHERALPRAPLDPRQARRLEGLGYALETLPAAWSWPESVPEPAVVVEDRQDFLSELGVLRTQVAENPTNDLALAVAQRLTEDIDAGGAEAPPREAARLHYWLGQLHLLRGDATAAVEAFEQALSIEGLGADLHVDLARAYQRLGNMPEALKHFELAWVHRPEDDGLRQTLADALLRTGIVFGRADRHEAARWCLERHLMLEPDSPSGHMNLALVIFSEGRIEEAESAMQLVVERFPRYEVARRNLDRIRARAQGDADDD